MLNDSIYLNMIDAPLFAVMQQLARAVIATLTRGVAVTERVRGWLYRSGSFMIYL